MLFRKTPEIKKYLPANTAFKLEPMESFIEHKALPELILPLLGKEQYDALHAAYRANNMDAKLKALLPLVQYPLANYAALRFLPWAQVNFSDSGVHITTSNESKTAFEWQINMLRTECLESAFNGMELLLAFLEDHKEDYEEWRTSSAYTISKECFINSAKDFSEYYGIGGSRRTFAALRPIMKRIEKTYIQKTICIPLYEELKQQIKDDELNDENSLLLGYIGPALASLTIRDAIAKLPVMITADGLQVLSSSSTTLAQIKVPTPDGQLEKLRRQAEAEGEQYLGELRQFLYDNIEDYPAFLNSPCYVDPDDEEEWDQSENPIFSV
jgi:hypothetical protein